MVYSLLQALPEAPAFFGSSFLLPLGALALSGTGRGEDDRIRIALCAQDPSGLAVRTVQALTEPSKMRGDMFVFYACEDEEEIRAQVASRRAECGYVFYEGFEEKLAAGNYRAAIGMYTAPSTVAASWLRRRCLRPWFKIMTGISWRTMWRLDRPLRGLGEAESPERSAAAQQAGELYDKWLSDGGTFQFAYQQVDAKNSAESADKSEASSALFPLRGLTAVCIFIAGLYGAVSLGEDERKGLFYPLAPESRLVCRLAALAAPLSLAAVSGLLTLLAGGLWTSAFREIGAMAVYALAVGAASGSSNG